MVVADIIACAVKELCLNVGYSTRWYILVLAFKLCAAYGPNYITVTRHDMIRRQLCHGLTCDVAIFHVTCWQCVQQVRNLLCTEQWYTIKAYSMYRYLMHASNMIWRCCGIFLVILLPFTSDWTSVFDYLLIDFLACLFIYLLNYLLIVLLTYLLMFFDAIWFSYLLNYLLTHLFAVFPTYLRLLMISICQCVSRSHIFSFAWVSLGDKSVASRRILCNFSDICNWEVAVM